MQLKAYCCAIKTYFDMYVLDLIKDRATRGVFMSRENQKCRIDRDYADAVI
ncbi:hypothetical protein VAS14_09304 [Photobacterium angustum S14]|uniref:Uncharacterized protein n=1 Tax=Photobacterium angustum (strain S14 / CCUG 15956) TaxID=314292 RepID=Q1ZX64_PHOAS|nr:hypothetical protein VAS14_09304 [Photobacterium angustum S14]